MKRHLILPLLAVLAFNICAAAWTPAKKITVREFLKMSDKDSTFCELTGVVTRVRNYEMGRLFLDDGTGNVLIYGVYDAREHRHFLETDVRKGDTLTVRGRRYVYDNRVIEMKNALYAGHKEGPDHKNVKRFDELDVSPTFKGKGKQEFAKWVSAHLKYPEEARNSYSDGQVTVRFVVGRNGMVLEPKIIESSHPALNEEVLRVLSISPKWKPGIVDGHPVRVTYTMPVNFVLDK